MNYITNNDTIIFDPSFNDELDFQLLKNYKTIIFSNYVLNESLFDAYENNNFDGLKYDSSKFNQFVDNLSLIKSSITHLTLGSSFNQSVDNLPSSITYLTFGIGFNKSLNNLPRLIEFIQLPEKYENKILNIPKKLKVIKCSKKYKYINDFVGLEVIPY